MIQSMTGFGKATKSINNTQYNIEIRTLNSKNLDLNFRIPSALKTYELSWRKHIATILKRGKIDLSINYQKNEEVSAIQFNKKLIQKYVEELKSILPKSDELENSKLLEIAMSLPESTIKNEQETSVEEANDLLIMIKEAIEQVEEFRKKEGEHLLTVFKTNVNEIKTNLKEIEQIDQNRVIAKRAKLHNALADLKVDYDENRLEQELIYYIEKFDISEEKTRLTSHINYFFQTIDSPTSNGKKLNFIAQEMGREINTIGSKANDAEIQNYVVNMKDQLEKIKEQLLNIL